MSIKLFYIFVMLINNSWFIPQYSFFKEIPTKSYGSSLTGIVHKHVAGGGDLFAMNNNWQLKFDFDNALVEADELWRDIIQAEGYYQVSNYGRVKRTNLLAITKGGKLRRDKEKILSIHFEKGEYLGVSLSVRNRHKTVRVHRLVAQAFIPNPDNKPEINHKNGIKYDNRVSNLEWVTSQENVQHSFDVLERIGSRSMLGRRGKDSPFHKKIIAYSGKCPIAIFNGGKEAERVTGFCSTNIYCAVKKNVKRYGFNWRSYDRNNN